MTDEISAPDNGVVVADHRDLVALTTPVLDRDGNVDVVLTVLSVFPRSRIVGSRLKPKYEAPQGQ